MLLGVFGCGKVRIFVKIGDFGHKSAGFIRVCGCEVLCKIEGGGSTNVRLDFSDFGDW